MEISRVHVHNKDCEKGLSLSTYYVLSFLYCTITLWRKDFFTLQDRKLRIDEWSDLLKATQLVLEELGLWVGALYGDFVRIISMMGGVERRKLGFSPLPTLWLSWLHEIDEYSPWVSEHLTEVVTRRWKMLEHRAIIESKVGKKPCSEQTLFKQNSRINPST